MTPETENQTASQPLQPEVPQTRPQGRFARLLDSSLAVGLAFVLAFAMGMAVHWGFFSGRGKSTGQAETRQTSQQAAQDPQGQQTTWYCSMHPSVESTEPGVCPICEMDLIPRDKRDPADPLALTPATVEQLRIQTVPAQRRYVTARVEMTGQVEYDETRVARITAWVAGRLERLYVDFTGMAVRQGDHMVEIYSPELLAAQQEWIQARKAVESLEADASALVRQTTEAGAEAAREKLELMGLSDKQIRGIAEQGRARRTVTIHAPQGGIVTQRHADQGDYVQVGSPIYTIADLRNVWVKFNAYESDVQWLRLGQDVRFTVRSWPGEVFQGTISFISPTVDPQSRTVRVRISAENEDGRLKPEMTATGLVESKIAAGGKVVDPQMAGKWLCPMHPGQVADSAGNCPVCGMALETAESLGYEPADSSEAPRPLVVPASAVLWTGRRSVVYVETTDPQTGNRLYHYRQVTLGPRAGGYYIVREGLDQGDQVATQGNFKIDSQRQIDRLHSMMNPPDRARAPRRILAVDRQGEPFRRGLTSVVEAYFEMTEALASDDARQAIQAAARGLERLGKVPGDSLDPDVRAVWQANAADLAEAWTAAAGAEDIHALRKAYQPVSQRIKRILEHFGPPGGQTLYWAHCPMAFDNRGAGWLQPTRQVRNPYFGAAMLRCGSIEQDLSPRPESE